MRKLFVTAAMAAAGAVFAGATMGATEGPASGPFQFTPLAASTPCTAGGNPTAPFVLPAGYGQEIITREGDGGAPNFFDMLTLNETGPAANSFLYRTHEDFSGNSAVSVTELETLTTRVLARRADWEGFDGLVWTPWRTLLTGEEVDIALLKDPAFPAAVAGLAYEIDPTTGAATPRPALGSRSHEGMRFDPQGNLYGITETSRVDNSVFQEGPGGFLYRFTPDEKGDLSSGQLYALKIVEDMGDRTGEAVWIPLDRAAVQIDADADAFARGATGWDRPEDVEMASSTGNSRAGGSNVFFVAITSEDRVLRVDLRQPAGGSDHLTAFVTDYVRAGANAPVNEFDFPDNLALDKNGNLYITEDPGGSAPAKTIGDDIWVAIPANGNTGVAKQVVRFASLTDCNAEPTGVYFDETGSTLYVNVQHRGGDGVDYTVRIFELD